MTQSADPDLRGKVRSRKAKSPASGLRGGALDIRLSLGLGRSGQQARSKQDEGGEACGQREAEQQGENALTGLCGGNAHFSCPSYRPGRRACLLR